MKKRRENTQHFSFFRVFNSHRNKQKQTTFYIIIKPYPYYTLTIPYCVLTTLLVPADSSGPSSTVSSAGPSSPTTADTSPRFSFSEKVALTPQSSEEAHSCHHGSCQPVAATVRPPDLISPDLCPPEDQGTFGDLSPPEDTAPEPTALGLPALDEKPEYRHEDEPEDETPGHASADPGPSRTLPCSPIADLSLAHMESYCCLPGSLPMLPELRESGSEAGSSSQTPQSPEVPLDEFFDTRRTGWTALAASPLRGRL